MDRHSNFTSRMDRYCILLGIGLCPKKLKRTYQCIALALVLYRRLVAMQWKAQSAPSVAQWREELIRWAKAEAQTLQNLLDKGILVKGLDTWNSFVIVAENKDDERPPSNNKKKILYYLTFQ
ncbi:hypothetical protein NDU88_007078 [Pleurodeles waltl]|uniref:Uncharacterized protein n=1 Tax=Pleurodeles waltl TaxID=8319 RepID=A0AAV7SRE9_PLEWA|nr:hypothetical protein NDU88_007078 [Pleurodeles waltl]